MLARMATNRELQPGDTLGQYRLESVLGEGGMGLVFRAVRESDGQVVALKLLKLELYGDFVFKERFKQEARAAAEVQSRHLVPIIEAGEADGRQYLAVAYVDGQSLEQRLAERGQLSVDETVKIATDIAAGLDVLHASGVVHRDIKSSNILIDQEGVGMLTDFGLAKGRAYTVLTRPGQVMGTLDYLAPELIRGKAASPASDIYALGCTVFECVAGQPPFADRGVFQVGLAHLEEPPPNPAAARGDVSSSFARTVLGALEKDPGKRPQSASEYAEALRRASGPTA
jgi:serine/threonine-protein kinase